MSTGISCKYINSKVLILLVYNWPGESQNPWRDGDHYFVVHHEEDSMDSEYGPA